MRILSTVALAALMAGCTTQASVETPTAAPKLAAGPEACSAVQAAALGAREAAGTWVDAKDGLPAYCEVKAVLSPAAGSNIGVVYRLPAAWNGKVLGLGGGGWAGNVTLMAATEGLKAGYATLQTDGGHPGTSPWDNAWAANPEAATDFAWRAVHEMTVAGKKLATAHYARAPKKAYFQGCSTGGRMALMEAQRFPADYDAISAGAPVYTLQVQTSAVLRNNTFAAGSGAGGFTAADLQLAKDTALATCDAADGLKDGLINNPRACQFDPGVLQCKGAKTASCLTPAQVTSLRAVYTGVKSPDGQWAMFPMSPGGETGWSLFVGTEGKGSDATGGGGLMGLANLLFGGRSVNFAALDPNVDVPQLRSSAFAQMYEAKNPDLSGFFGHGGKLILWHGENDPGPSPIGTNDYNRAVLAKNAAATNQLRYFLLPGVEHCRGGPGADQIALLEALDHWDESGKAPDVLVGTKADTTITRPHCAWPKSAHYRGNGNPNDPASWQCLAHS
jgi:feruloyl esterase